MKFKDFIAGYQTISYMFYDGERFSEGGMDSYGELKHLYEMELISVRYDHDNKITYVILKNKG